MSRQNRVTPWGEIISTPARGTFMGNRGGCMHDAGGELRVARWRSAQWIVCLLEFKGRRRTVMTPGRYTELFFLDEATALAAGHRPCAECQRQAFNRFRSAWLRGNPDLASGPILRAPALDRQLHAERVTRTRTKVTARMAIDDLPNGTFISMPPAAAAGEAWMVWHGRLLLWSPAGYTTRRVLPAGMTVEVLTPRSTVSTIAAGYAPRVHPSAGLGDD
jgi:hypothetical protein